MIITTHLQLEKFYALHFAKKSAPAPSYLLSPELVLRLFQFKEIVIPVPWPFWQNLEEFEPELESYKEQKRNPFPIPVPVHFTNCRRNQGSRFRILRNGSSTIWSAPSVRLFHLLISYLSLASPPPPFPWVMDRRCCGGCENSNLRGLTPSMLEWVMNHISSVQYCRSVF